MAVRLALRDIDKRFGSLTALRGVSFTLHAGKIHALLGENGAGKTTLMRIAYGLEQADSGAIHFNGQPVTLHSPRAARALGIGMVHQHFTSVPELSVGENVALAAGWRVRPHEIRGRVTTLCRELDLPLYPDTLAGALPVALKQRLEIVKALASRTSVLLLDEPTAVLAPSEADNLVAFLRRFAANGGSVALITHKLAEAAGSADWITVLRNGQVTFDGPTGDQSPATMAVHMIGQALPRTRRQPSPESSHEAVVKARGLAVSALPGQGTGLLDGTLVVRAGEVVGVAAVEGNGQRELLRAIAGVCHPLAGNLDVRGPVAFVPEDRTTEGLIPEMSITENMVLGWGPRADWLVGRWPRIVKWRQAGQACRSLLRDFGIVAPAAGSAVRNLSGGNQQKLVLARALVQRPQIVVAENPTRGLDVKATVDIHARLRYAAAHGAAVVFYSTDLDEVLEVADRIVVLQAGRCTEVIDHPDRRTVGALMVGGESPTPPNQPLE